MQITRRTLVVSFVCAFALTLAGSRNAVAQTSCVPPPSRQMQWFPGDGNTNDIVENGEGTLKNGATFAPGMVGQAFSLDGVDDYVELPSFLLPANFNALAIEAWIKPANVLSGHIADNAAPGGTDGFLLELSGGHLRAVFGANAATGGATIQADTYTHVAAVYDGSNIRLYVNGALDSTTPATTPGAVSRNSQNTFIGAGRVPATAFGGQIDEIEFYLRALTTGEIQAIANAGGAGKCKSGRALISEFRFIGPTFFNDEFIEIYNNSDAELVVRSTDGSAGWAVYEEGLGGGVRFVIVIPNGTRIPARGHYLAVNSGNAYSLSNYAGTGQATPDATYARDLCYSCGIILSSSARGDVSPDHRLDRVGFNNTSMFFREGRGIPLAPAGVNSASQYSFVRKMTNGAPQDTNDNAADFVLVSTEPAVTGGVFGAPAPENLRSPLQRNKTVEPRPLDSGAAASAPPNRARQATDTDGDGTTDADVLKIRRTFTNLTRRPITHLRFRVVDITTTPRPDNSKADLRVINSQNETVNISAAGGGGTKIVTGLTLEDLRDTNNGRPEGGLNSSLAYPLAQPLQPGESVNVNFWLRVVTDGEFSFLVNVEATTLPASVGERKRGNTTRTKTSR